MSFLHQASDERNVESLTEEPYLNGLRRIRQLLSTQRSFLSKGDSTGASNSSVRETLSHIGKSLLQDTARTNKWNSVNGLERVTMPSLSLLRPPSSPLTKALSRSQKDKGLVGLLPSLSTSLSAVEFTARLKNARLSRRSPTNTSVKQTEKDAAVAEVASASTGWKKVKKAALASAISTAFRRGGERFAERRWSQSRNDFYQPDRAQPRGRDADLTPRRKYDLLCQTANVLPDARLIISRTSNTHQFDFSNFRASGKKFLLAIQAIVKTHPHAMHVVDISQNSFSDRTAAEFIWMCKEELASCDLSYNQIGRATCRAINATLTSNMCRLKELNLCDIETGRGLNSDCLTFIADGVRANSTLRRLNLKRTKLDDVGVYALAAAMTESSCCITDLDVSCNHIRESAGALLACKDIENLNLSHNRLGDKSFAEIALQICTNKTLLHLDMTGIVWPYNRAKQLATALCDNHTLLGYHIAHWNTSDPENRFTCKIDAKGFLHVQRSKTELVPKHDEQRNPSDATHSYRAKRGWLHTPQVLRSNRLHQHPGDASIRGCWLCGGWMEHKFVLTTEQAPRRLAANAQVNIHLHIDQANVGADGQPPMTDLGTLKWPATKMKCVREGQRARYHFEVYRVLPPGTVYFYFSSDGVEGPFLAKPGSVIRQQTVPVPRKHWLTQLCRSRPVQKTDLETEDGTAKQKPGRLKTEVLERLQEQVEEVSPFRKRRQERVRKREGKPEPSITSIRKSKTEPKVNLNYVDNVATDLAFNNSTAVPRPQVNSVFRPSWNLKRSVFAPRMDEWHSHDFVTTTTLYKQAFEVDWRNMNVPHVFRHTLNGSQGEAEVQTLKEAVRENYKRLIEIFRAEAISSTKAVTTDSALFCWSWLKFVTFTKDCRLFHTRFCNAADLDIIFVKANNNDKSKTESKGNKDDRTENKSTSRQLSRFEFLLCLILIAEKRFGDDTLTRATKTLVEGLILPCFDKLKSDDDWRSRHLYQQPISDILIANYDRLERKFRAHTKDQARMKMTITDWFSFAKAVGIQEEKQALDGNSNIRQQRNTTGPEDKNAGTGNSDSSEDDRGRVKTSLTQKVIMQAFMKSVMMVRNRARSNAYKRMSMTDFLEGICRLAASICGVTEQLQPNHLEHLFAKHIFRKVSK